MPQIFVLSGPEVGKSFVIRHGDDVGRTPECIVTLKHASISRRHAHFERDGDRWFVVDDGSRNGIIVAKTRVTRLELEDRKEFQLGELLVRFVAGEPDSASSAGAPSSPAANPPRSVVSEPAIPAPPAPRAERAAPPAQALDIDELQLEDADEIQLDAPPSPAPPRAPSEPLRAASPPPLVDPNLVMTTVSPRVPPPPPPQFANSMLDTGFGRAAPGAGATISRSKERSGERILQYHKVANTGGLAGAELSQLSAPVRWTLVALAVVVMAALAYLAFSGTNLLKEKIAAPEPLEQPEER